MNGLDFKLELIAVPVSDVDASKAFYVDKAGFHADHDGVAGEVRFVQLTPPGSACSIVIGKGVTEMAPGSSDFLLLVVDDVEKARAELVDRGIDASDVTDLEWGRFTYFADLDGNNWSVQELPKG